jgi:hypothetical protein
MKKVFIILTFLFSLNLSAQNAIKKEFDLKKILEENKGKAVLYNSLGMGVLPHDALMAGGNHVSYRKYGFGISWRVGVKSILDTREKLFSSVTFENASNNKWFTGEVSRNYVYNGCLNFVLPITKKIPFYVGAGVTRIRQFDAIHPLGDPTATEWIVNEDETKFDLNLTAGVFVPISGRFLLNVGYDHLPQTVFVGICITGPYVYEDLDMW